MRPVPGRRMRRPAGARMRAPEQPDLAPGHRGQDRDLVAVGDLRVEPVHEADVLAAHVDVHEAAQPAVLGDAGAQLAVAVVQRVEHLPHRGAVDLGRRLSSGGLAQLGGDPDRDWHTPGSYHAAARTRSPAASKLASVGSITRVSNVPRAQSSVLSPSPVITATTRSPGSIAPARASLASTAVVTPPAVSVKIPVLRARSLMPSTISSSLTASMLPPLRRARSSAYGPSAGLPMASDLAIVSGFTGRQKSCPAANALATGEHPSAWAPLKAGSSPPSNPASIHSSNPRASFVNSDPEAIGATTRSGSSKPSCSAVSKASVLEPSE